MDTVLLVLALTLNAADATVTCRDLAAGQRELNPLLGGRHATCGRVVATKAAAFAVVPLFKGRFRTAWLGGVAVGGGAGLVISLRY